MYYVGHRHIKMFNSGDEKYFWIWILEKTSLILNTEGATSF
jgi:hypothetical protein